MTVLDITEVRLEWSDLNRLTYHPRPEMIRSGSEEQHVSHVLKSIAQQQKRWTKEDELDDMPLRILLGLAFEEAAARLYKHMIWQPGEIEFDGLIGSPDGISILNGIPTRSEQVALSQVALVCVDEFKYSGKSQRIKGRKPQPDGNLRSEDLKDIRTEWLWMQQCQTYINLLRRRFPKEYKNLNLGRFHICWKYGAYVFPMLEVYYRYLVQFTEEELAGNWAMMQAFK
jgi:hypothetical protein